MDKEDSTELISKYSVDSQHLREQRERAIDDGDELDDALRIPWGRNYD